MSFAVGQKVIYPGHGLAVIKRIETRNNKEFYILEVVYSGMVVILPILVNSLRPLISKFEAKQIEKILATSETPYKDTTSTWNRRYREYMEVITTGKTKEIAYVLNSLLNIAKAKDLSFGERKMIDHCKTLINSELKEIGVA